MADAKAKFFEALIELYKKKMSGKFDRLKDDSDNITGELGSSSRGSNSLAEESEEADNEKEAEKKDGDAEVTIAIVANDEEMNPALAAYKDKIAKRKSSNVKPFSFSKIR